jgi:hypothetical protein
MPDLDQIKQGEQDTGRARLKGLFDAAHANEFGFSAPAEPRLGAAIVRERPPA